MSTVRKHSCVAVAAPPTPSASRRRIKRPRRVIASRARLEGDPAPPAATGRGRSKSDGAVAVARGNTLPEELESVSHRRDPRGGDWVEKCENETRASIGPVKTIHSDVLKGSEKSSRTVLSDSERVKYADRSKLSGVITQEGTTRKDAAHRPTETIKCSKIIERPATPSFEEYFSNKNFKSTASMLVETPGARREGGRSPDSCASSESYRNCPRCLHDPPDELLDVSRFRERHFFECHSVEAMLQRPASALRDARHRCNYRFYLNERLFPVPLNSDHESAVRCSDCHLPVQLKERRGRVRSQDGINGTIQAKVCVGAERAPRDIVLVLPVDAALVTQQGRRPRGPSDDDVVHFGILKIDNRRATFARSSVPGDSFALRYQRGYREFKADREIKYAGLEDNDVVIV